jgi:hypothetical protein
MCDNFSPPFDCSLLSFTGTKFEKICLDSSKVVSSYHVEYLMLLFICSMGSIMALLRLDPNFEVVCRNTWLVRVIVTLLSDHVPLPPTWPITHTVT